MQYDLVHSTGTEFVHILKGGKLKKAQTQKRERIKIFLREEIKIKSKLLFAVFTDVPSHPLHGFS